MPGGARPLKFLDGELRDGDQPAVAVEGCQLAFKKAEVTLAA